MRVASSGPFNALLARKDTQSQFSQRAGLHSFATRSLKLGTGSSFSRRKTKVVRQRLSTGLKLKRKSRYLGLSLGIHPSNVEDTVASVFSSIFFLKEDFSVYLV
ncbi:hypothetical protein POTOM_041672 [Populus tomentosa]|uniref:Uncharacterized protein n=1 Tax=Populus tomentosa TaxID=118781 RepID=A0A8X7YPK4_POPTO|nr:hypothetical protein POTOM_041672 [Populus tomentosa]